MLSTQRVVVWRGDGIDWARSFYSFHRVVIALYMKRPVARNAISTLPESESFKECLWAQNIGISLKLDTL